MDCKELSYCENDVSVLNELYKMHMKSSVEREMNSIRNRIEFCDDTQYREYLARKLSRLRRELSLIK